MRRLRRRVVLPVLLLLLLAAASILTPLRRRNELLPVYNASGPKDAAASADLNQSTLILIYGFGTHWAALQDARSGGSGGEIVMYRALRHALMDSRPADRLLVTWFDDESLIEAAVQKIEIASTASRNHSEHVAVNATITRIVLITDRFYWPERTMEMAAKLPLFHPFAAQVSVDRRSAGKFGSIDDKDILQSVALNVVITLIEPPKVYEIEYFGLPEYLVDDAAKEMGVHGDRVLSAYPNQFNTFLGYVPFLPHLGTAVPVVEKEEQNRLRQCLIRKKNHTMKTGKLSGIIWGKEMRYLTDIADQLWPSLRKLFTAYPQLEIHTTISAARDYNESAIPEDLRGRMINHAFLERDAYMDLLCGQGLFLLGLGDPVVGPTALEAVLLGNVYLNPVYTSTRHINAGALSLLSQHDPLALALNDTWVCSISWECAPGESRLDCSGKDRLTKCVTYAIERLEGLFMLNENDVPTPAAIPAFTYAAYVKRVHALFRAVP